MRTVLNTKKKRISGLCGLIQWRILIQWDDDWVDCLEACVRDWSFSTGGRCRRGRVPTKEAKKGASFDQWRRWKNETPIESSEESAGVDADRKRDTVPPLVRNPSHIESVYRVFFVRIFTEFLPFRPCSRSLRGLLPKGYRVLPSFFSLQFRLQ